jgi:hypothetical protein
MYLLPSCRLRIRPGIVRALWWQRAASPTPRAAAGAVEAHSPCAVGLWTRDEAGAPG